LDCFLLLFLVGEEAVLLHPETTRHLLLQLVQDEAGIREGLGDASGEVGAYLAILFIADKLYLTLGILR